MANYYLDDDGKLTTKKKKKGTEYVLDKSGKLKKVEDDDDIAPVTSKDKNKDTKTEPLVFTKKEDDDIAPVAQAPGIIKGKTKENLLNKHLAEKNRTWFDKGVFKDGYQFGDVTKGILGTRTDAETHIGAGLIGIGEKLADAGAMIGNAMYQQNMAEQMAYDAMANSLTGKETALVEQTAELKKEMDKSTAEFVAKDLYDEEAIAKKIISDPVKKLTGVDSETDSFLGEKSDDLAVSGGQLLGQIGINAALPGSGMVVMGLTSFSSEVENALNNGATYDEAVLSGTVSAVGEMLTERIAGIGLGGKTLTDVAFEKLSSKMTSKFAKALITSAKLTADAAGGGLEEVASGYITALGQKISYMEDKEIEELFSNEDKWESFIGGLVLEGGFGGAEVAFSNRDYVTGMTKNEQAVVDKVYNDAVAEKETDGKKLTSSEKSKLYDSVVEKMDKGGIDIDTIEEVLGGESYDAYKKATDENAALKKELDELNDIKASELTGKQSDRLAELKAMNLDDTTKTDELRKKLSDDVYSLAKDSRLFESYNERTRKGQAFEADLTKYTGKQREAVERAINSGVLNNTNRSHELVDILSKIEADKGITFDYTNNDKLKESGFAIEGKTVNGFVKGDNVTLNVSSSKAWESTVGHEITHVLEGTEAYNELQSALFKYAESKGELATRKAEIVKLYENVENADIDGELTAELVSDYLFTDKNFINHLTGNRTVFQKVWDEVKYLYSVATGKEKTSIEKVMKEFDKAWETFSAEKKTSVEEAENVKYSLNIKHTDGTVEELADARSLTSEQAIEYLNQAGKGKLRWNTYIPVRKDTPQVIIDTLENAGESVANRSLVMQVRKAQQSMSKQNKGGRKTTHSNNTRGHSLTPEEVVEIINNLDNPNSIILQTNRYNDEGKPLPNNVAVFVEYNSNSNEGIAVIEFESSIDNEFVGTEFGETEFHTVVTLFEPDTMRDGIPFDYAEELLLNPNNYELEIVKRQPTESAIGKKHPNTLSKLPFSNDSIAPITENVNTKFSLSTDSDYNSAVERGDTETAQKMVEETANNLGYNIRAYHGTARGDRVGNVFLPERATSGPMAYFTDNKDIASNYARDKADTSLAYDEEYDSYYTQFRVNRNGKSISIPELWKHLSVAERNRIKERAAHVKFDDDYETIIVDETAQHGNGAWDAYTLNMHRGNALEALVDTWLETGDLYNQEELFLDVLKNVGITDAEYRNPDARYEKVYDTWLKITKPFDTDDANQSFYDSLSEWIENNDMSVYEKETANADMWDKNNQTPESWLRKLEDDIENGTTNAWTVIPDFVTDYLKAQGYDGIKDKGGKGGGAGHTVWIPFSSEQIKSAEPITYDDNGKVIPLSERFNPNEVDIRHSLSNVNAVPSTIGTPLKDLALEQDIAPVAENVTEVVAENATTTDGATWDYDAPVFEAISSAVEEEAGAMQDEQVNTHSSTSLEAIQVQLENLKEERSDSLARFEQKIANKQAELNSKKNKDTKVANKLRMQIEDLKRRRDSVDADYAKAISTAETRERLAREGKPTTRQEHYNNIMNDVKATFSSGGLDFDDVLRKAKNLSTLSTVDNTPQRVMEKALGYKEGQVLADLTVNKVAQNETEGIKWLNSFTDRKNGLLSQISKQYDIKPGSKESAAAQMYAEGFYVADNNDIVAYGDAELAKDFSDEKVRNNIKGLAKDPRIRQIYDETLEAINESRTRNAYPEIQKLDNYFLHFRAMEDTFSKLGLPFNPNDIRAKDLPTDLNGVTADLKPGQPYFASANHRMGKRTSFDLLGGLEKYLTSAKNQIYHIDDIQTLRALRNYIADTYGQAKGLEGIDTLSEEEAQERIEHVYGSHLSTFAKFLNEEANVLAGKTTLIDRGLEGILGRRGMTFLNTVNKQVGSNMVGFNISSSLTNFIPVAQTFAKTNKFDFLKAFTQTVSNKVGSVFGKGDSFAENSPVIIRRKGTDRFYRTPFQKIGDAGYVLMSAVDDISTELIARTKFNELTRKGMSEQQAHFETDKWVSRLMGDRSLGQQPQMYNSKALGVFTKFQLEVRNQLDSQFYDTIQEAKVSNEEIENALARNAKTAAKVTSTFVQLAVAQHLFGKAFESVAGYNPAFDIISTLATMFGFDDDEESEDTALDNIEQGFFELLEDLPYTSTFTGGRIPISSALPVEQFIKGQDSYGNEKSRVETFFEAAPYYVLPGGYGQIKKTAQGLNMFNTDEEHPVSGSYTDSGNLRFPVEDTPLNRVQAGLFGQYASKNAREYFDNGYAPLNEKQIQEYIDVDLPIADYWKYRKGLSNLEPLEGKKSVTLNQKGDYIGGLDLPVSKKNILINNIANDRETPIDFTGYENYTNFEEFDFATRYPEKYAVLKEQGISVADYKENHEETAFMYTDDYSWAANNPDAYTVSKAVTNDVKEYKRYTTDLYNIKADKDKNGKSISGSGKEKVVDYINNLDVDYGAKLILFKAEYPSDDTYNYEIIEYIENRQDFTYDERVSIYTKLGFTVNGNTVSWN